MLDVQEEGEHNRWYDFIAECEYLLLRNVYNDTELKCMKEEDIEKYYENFNRLVDLFPVVERALETEEESSEFNDFVIEELENVYYTSDEL